MKPTMIVLAGIIVAALAVFMLGTDVDIKDEGALPEVDVSVDADAGRLPDVAVKTPQLNVTTGTSTVEVPEVNVTTETKKVTYPTVDLKAAEDSVIDEAAETDPVENE